MKKLLIALLALLTLASCAEKKPSIPLYGWDSIGKNPNLEEVRAKFQNYKAHGFTGICVQADTTPGSPACCKATSRTTGTA